MIEFDGEDRTAGPLNGWRAIAEYLGRNQSTVKRWANDGGLPVHRPQGSAPRKGVPVYAFAEELDAWLRGQQPDDEIADDAMTGPDEPAAGRGHMSRRVAFAGGIGAALIVLAGAGLRWRGQRAGVAPVSPVISEEALGLYHRGLFHMDLRTRDGFAQAIRLFEDALALEPDFIDASAALAQACNLAVQYGVFAADEGYPRALETAQAVLERSPDHPGALAALAFNTFYWLRDFNAAYDLFERAQRLDPENEDIHHWYALAVMHDRRFDIALREIEAAQRLSPTSPAILANKALILHHSGQSEEALAILEPLAESQPGLLSAISYLATIYLDLGRDRDFIAAREHAAELLGFARTKEIAAAARHGFEQGGRAGMLGAMLDVQTRLLEEGSESAFRVAVTAAYLGQSDLALDYLDLAIEQDEPNILGIRLELPAAQLRHSPRYGELVTRIGFSDY